MKTPARHRNITVKRLLLDAYQFVRAQSFMSKRFGRQFLPSREFVEIDITYKCNLKDSRVNLFKPFNVAPVDNHFYRYSDYTCGCRIIEECGLGLTPSGYYMCAIAGGIDRIYRYNLGRKKMSDESDTFSDQMSAFCRLCGHFGFQWPTRISKQSKTWRRAYSRFTENEIRHG